jgi:hypothetical protein
VGRDKTMYINVPIQKFAQEHVRTLEFVADCLYLHLGSDSGSQITEERKARWGIP